MGYFKRKRTNKKKGKRGTKRYRGGANSQQPFALENGNKQQPNALENGKKQEVTTEIINLLTKHNIAPNDNMVNEFVDTVMSPTVQPETSAENAGQKTNGTSM